MTANDYTMTDQEQAEAHEFPRMTTISPAFLYKGVVRALEPSSSEYVTVPPRYLRGSERHEISVAMSQWNALWEAAQFRRRLFSEEVPVPMRQVAEQGDVNVVFVPRTSTRYHEYAPLFHLLPRSVLEHHGLPLLPAGIWPFLIEEPRTQHALPPDFERRLSRAWAHVVWRDLMPGSPMRGFTDRDPIRLLAHNLDFWIPPVTAVLEDILREFPTVDNGIDEGPALLEDGSYLDGAVTANPRMGGDLWTGEDEARAVISRVVGAADSTGRLREILDAVRSNRVEDDFSSHWTYAREDFERKLYRKRNKVQVQFVELKDVIPVQGPEAEVVGDLVTADFLALLDKKQRRIVVLLSSGVTKLGDVASIMGYANHSPISKELSRIRDAAMRYFD